MSCSFPYRFFAQFCLGFVLLIVCTPVSQAAEGLHRHQPGSKIIVGGDRYYPPYEYLDEDDRPTGFNVELTRAIAEVMGVEVEFRLGPWDEIRRDFDAGRIDVLQGIVYTKSRSQKYAFSPPHNILHESVFARRGKTERGVYSVSSLDQLSGKELIVQKSGFMYDYLLEHKLDAKFFFVDTHAAALRLLASGEHDYALVGNLPGLYLGKELGLSNIEPVGKVTAGERYGYAVVKGNEDLLAIFSEGLAILKNTGKHQQLYDKWLGPLEPRGIPWKKIAPILGGALGILGVILFSIMVWNRMLKREVARRARELQQHQQQLIQADKMASLGILVSGVAHEINNPNSLALLNMPIVIAAHEDSRDILEEYYRNNDDFSVAGIDYSRMRDELPQMLAEMFDGAKRIKRIVDDLKDFVRPEGPICVQSLDINALVKTAVRLVENSIHKATQNFSQSYATELPLVNGNSQRIEQVVVNLLLNACQALQDPDEAIVISTRHDRDAGMVLIEVRDEGCGIEPDQLAHVTDPFFTTKRETGGTGLGLSVSATIVEQHGGSLDFTSVPGEGTRVLLGLAAAHQGDI